MQGWQRVGALTDVPIVVREVGGDPDRVAAAAGVSLADLSDRENRIPFASACALLKAAAEFTSCEHFPLLVALRNDTHSLGLVGALMRNATSWGRAFLDLCENQHR